MAARRHAVIQSQQFFSRNRATSRRQAKHPQSDMIAINCETN
jgi:hypothetical protein